MASSESGRHATRRSLLSGELTLDEVSRALGLLLDRQLAGALTITDGAKDLCLAFAGGGVRVYGAPRALPTIRARLVAKGVMKARDAKETGRQLRVRSVEESARDAAREEREHLIEELGLPAAQVDEAIAEALRDVVLATFFWDQACFELTSEPDPDVGGRRDLPTLALPAGAHALVSELQQALRLTGEVARLRERFGDLDRRAAATAKGKDAFERRQPLGEGPGRALRERLLVQAVKQPVDLRLAPEHLRVGEYELLTRVAELVDEGYLELQRRAPSEEERRQRARAMEAGLARALDPTLRRSRLALAWAAVGDAEQAARHLARAGHELQAQGRGADALERHAKALSLAPGDLEVLEGFVQSAWTVQVDQALAQSLPLARRYLQLGLHARARRTLERALARAESTEGLELMMEVHLAQRRTDAALEVGERLALRLRREGRADEARALAARLLALGDPKAREKIMRAAGIDKRKVAALLVLGALIGSAFLPVKAQAKIRERYREQVARVRQVLGAPRPLQEVDPVLAGLRDELEQLASEAESDPLVTSAVPDKAREVVAELELIRTDCQNGAELLELLPWQGSPDVEYVHQRVTELQPRSEAFERPRRRLLEQLNELRARAEAAQAKLSLMGPSDEALALARSMQQEFRNMPQLLSRTFVRLRVESEPAGARVRYDGIDYSSPTPLELQLPLRGTRELQLTVARHEPLVRTLALETVEGTTLRYALQPRSTGSTAAGGGGVVRVEPTGEPAERPDPGTPDRRPREARPKSPTEAPRAVTSGVELIDGRVVGERPDDLAFEGGSGLVDGIKLDPRFRARVIVRNVLEGSKVYIAGVQVVLYSRTRSGWKAERPTTLELDDRRERPVVLQPGGKRLVQRLERTLHLDEPALRERIKVELGKAMRRVLDRQRGRR